MNRIILSLLIVLFPFKMMGQMFPSSDHYIYDALAINPAFAGSHDAFSATLIYRKQWVGFKDAPKSQILSIHTPVDNDRIGLGFMIESNSIGIYKETCIAGSYAFRMEVHGGKLALGLGFGVKVLNIAWNDLIVNDANDLQLMNNPISQVMPIFSLGTYYSTKKYFVGISMPLFSSYVLDPITGKYKIKNNFFSYNYFFTGGYEVSLSSKDKLIPSILVKYHPNNAVQIDYNLQVKFKDRIWLGFGYRNSNVLVSMLQCQLNYQLRVAYSYDFNLSTIGKYTGGSHEIMLNYVFRYTRKVKGPRQF